MKSLVFAAICLLSPRTPAARDTRRAECILCLSCVGSRIPLNMPRGSVVTCYSAFSVPLRFLSEIQTMENATFIIYVVNGNEEVLLYVVLMKLNCIYSEATPFTCLWQLTDMLDVPTCEANVGTCECICVLDSELVYSKWRMENSFC